MNGQELLKRIALHFAMGAGLGASFMMLMLAFNLKNLSNVVVHSASPVIAVTILIVGTSLYFAFGAAVTGFHFILAEE